MKHSLSALTVYCITLCIIIFSGGCSKHAPSEKNSIAMSLTRTVTTLDPALAGDSASRSLAAAFYDTPLQYKYVKGSYELEPASLETMPQISENGRKYTLTLRKDLYFQEGRAYRNAPPEERQVKASDLAFSIMRLADARLNSPGYGLIRGKIKGIEKFRAATMKAPKNSLAVYDTPPEGLKALSDNILEIELEQEDPRFHYALALPFFSIVSRRELEKANLDITRTTAGSGAFILSKFNGDHSLEMIKYKDFRSEYYNSVRLPAADKITCYFVKQPFAAWLMFLQGNLDYYSLDGENFNATVDENGNLADALVKRGIQLLSAPQLETNYIGL